ncbi:MAG: hypothetical protein Fur0037_26220 [Planctomycetota bacterium]
MDSFLETAAKGVLPPLALGLLASGVVGTRWLGVAASIGSMLAWMLLRGERLLWPWELFAGSQDATQWLLWCLAALALASAVASPGKGKDLRGIRSATWLLPLFLAAAWLPFSNLRRSWAAGETAILTLEAVAVLWLASLTFCALPARRPGPFLPSALLLCLAVDAGTLLTAASSGLLAQLAGALAASLGGGLAVLWPCRDASGLDLLPLGAGHAGLLLLGWHLAYEPDRWALGAAFLAPLAFWLPELPPLARRPAAGRVLGSFLAALFAGFALARGLGASGGGW